MKKFQLFLLCFILSPIALLAQGDSITIKGQLHTITGDTVKKIVLSFTNNNNKKQFFFPAQFTQGDLNSRYPNNQ